MPAFVVKMNGILMKRAFQITKYHAKVYSHFPVIFLGLNINTFHTDSFRILCFCILAQNNLFLEP